MKDNLLSPSLSSVQNFNYLNESICYEYLLKKLSNYYVSYDERQVYGRLKS